MREVCWKCRKARVTCYCARLTPFDSDPVFAILSHPRELRNPVGTGRMLHLSLRNSLLFDAHSYADHVGVSHLLANPSLYCALLYPGPTSLDLSGCSPAEAREWFPSARKSVLFIIDGTWDLARAMINRSPNLQRLPRLGFTPSQRSGYRIRTQPDAHCLSTIETAHWVLRRLAQLGLRESDAREEQLLRPFEAMVEEQLRYGGEASRPRTEGLRLPSEVSPC